MVAQCTGCGNSYSFQQRQARLTATRLMAEKRLCRQNVGMPRSDETTIANGTDYVIMPTKHMF